MRWAIATVLYESAKSWYVRSLFETLNIEFNVSEDPEYILVDHLYMPNAREEAARAALTLDLAGVLWIDSDMKWSADRVRQMLSLVRLHPKAVIAFPYPARKEQKWIGEPEWSELPNKHGLIAARQIGFGFTWTPIECFRRPEPWFNVQFVKGEGFIGEDIYFARNLPASIPILVAPKHPVGHSYEPGPRFSPGPAPRRGKLNGE